LGRANLPNGGVVVLGEKLKKVRQGEASAEVEAPGLLESSELNSVELPVQLRVSELESEV
jgi:hypothetical protein